MFSLNFTKRFIKKYQKLTKGDSSLKKRVRESLNNLADDPKSKHLKSHKIRKLNAWSSRVAGDIRIIWDYSHKKINMLDLLDIGGHSGKNSVYK